MSEIRKFLLKSPIKVACLARLFAKLIDLFIVLIIVIFLFQIGIIVAAVYIAFADSLKNGQSVGKKIIGLRVVSLEDNRPCSAKQSFVRNLPIVLPLLFAFIPVWGWLFSLLLGVPLILLEAYLLFTLDSGHRLGDVMADTTVVVMTNELLESNTKNKNVFDSKGPQANA